MRRRRRCDWQYRSGYWHREHERKHPTYVAQCLLQIARLRNDEAVSGSGEQHWSEAFIRDAVKPVKLSFRSRDAVKLSFRNHYELIRSDREVMLTIRANGWSAEIRGYFPARHTFNRWICPTCNKKNVTVFVRVANGQPVCHDCGFRLEE